ncbi:hypothetical protein AB0J86_14665 [Micromonospora sp. NPDC049559]|uniref:hypothetical protein n=1 Tax=Micromonospora sp. NPDC049559 TaxID=3155923 RepID=UPI003445C654
MTARIGATLAALTVAAVGATVAAAPASADDWPEPNPVGIYFYSGWFTEQVGHYRDVTRCLPVPPKAESHVGYPTSPVNAFRFFATDDCTGQATGMDTLRSYPAGQYRSFVGVVA